MSFVIKDFIERKDRTVQENYFDIEPYNYIRNRSCSFLEGSLHNNYNELKGVLKNFKEVDK